MPSSTHISRFHLLTALLALGAGCAGRDAADDGDVLAELDHASSGASIDGGTLDASQGAADGGGGTTPADAGRDSGLPSGAYFAEVFANGSGCPAGTWQTSISPDGQHFSTKFNDFAVEMSDREEFPAVTKNCVISILLRSPAGLSYSVKSVRFQGYAFLEAGVTATFWARYWFQGNPVPSNNSNRLTLVGPYDKDFVFVDDIDTRDALWSPCGTERDLNINAQLQLRNGTTKRAGYAHVGNNSDTFSLELAWKSCKPPQAAPVVSKK